MEIIFEDNHLLVVNKPAGLLTQPSGTLQDNLEFQCKNWIKEKFNKPGQVFLEAVHRLDKPVSGIVLFARTSKALSRLNESMREKSFVKKYCALVEGILDPREGALEHYLLHDDFQATVVSARTPEAKLSKLHYQTLKNNNLFSLVEITLETGRYHQIRAQLSATNHPIVGDKKYGSQVKFPPNTIALHHFYLEFLHPITKETLVFKSALPPTWSRLLA